MSLLRSLLAAALLAQALPCAAQQAAPGQAVATFAGGCFWCMEPPYDALPGVISTTSGYMGGTKKNPSYEEVSSGTTGHAEVVRVLYDPKQVSWLDLDTDARDALRFLATLPEVDPNALVVAGHSEGGQLAVHVGADGSRRAWERLPLGRRWAAARPRLRPGRDHQGRARRLADREPFDRRCSLRVRLT